MLDGYANENQTAWEGMPARSRASASNVISCGGDRSMEGDLNAWRMGASKG